MTIVATFISGLPGQAKKIFNLFRIRTVYATRYSMYAALKHLLCSNITQLNNDTWRHFVVYCLILSGLLTSHSTLSANESLSGSAAANKVLNEQRYHYELAKIALSKKNYPQFQLHYAKLGNYPLVPYLDYSLAKRALNPLLLDQIDSFLLKYQNSYLADRLQRQLIYKLANAKRWKDFVYYYSDSIRSTELRCQYLYARIQLGNIDAYEQVPELWATPKSLPKKCDPLFASWKSFGGMTDEVIWTRFKRSMNKGKTSLARYTKSLMSSEYLRHAELYEKLRHSPELIKQYNTFQPTTPYMRDVIVYGIQRFARKKPLEALYHWQFYEALHRFNEQQIQDAKHGIVTRLTRKGYSSQAQALIKQSPSLRKKDVVERLIRNSLKEQNWNDVLYGIENLPAKLKDTGRWQYWRARAEAELKLDGAKERSKATFNTLSQERSFYGFLSSDILSKDYSFEHVLSQVADEVVETVGSRTALVRAKELWLTGYKSEAQAEWRYGTRDMSARELEAVGVLAQKWGWHNKSIHAMIEGNHWDHLDIRFPLAYKDEVKKISKKVDIEPTLIYAIARQESAFLETAKSPVGARGLMQVMPATAQETARKSGISHRTEDLYTAEHNITIGSYYLHELLKKFNGNRILAAAAYNAGPHRVTRWMSNTKDSLPYDIWIEIIPFKETRHYVQNVLAYSVIYSYRLGQPTRLVTEQEEKRPL